MSPQSAFESRHDEQCPRATDGTLASARRHSVFDTRPRPAALRCRTPFECVIGIDCATAAKRIGLARTRRGRLGRRRRGARVALADAGGDVGGPWAAVTAVQGAWQPRAGAHRGGAATAPGPARGLRPRHGARGDALDALLCVVAGLDVVEGTAVGPTADERAVAERGGWIWVRRVSAGRGGDRTAGTTRPLVVTPQPVARPR